MRANEIRDLSDEELETEFNNAKGELFNLRFQLATNQLDNPLRIREVRRDIAKIQTIRKERELAASTKEQ